MVLVDHFGRGYQAPCFVTARLIKSSKIGHSLWTASIQFAAMRSCSGNNDDGIQIWPEWRGVDRQAAMPASASLPPNAWLFIQGPYPSAAFGRYLQARLLFQAFPLITKNDCPAYHSKISGRLGCPQFAYRFFLVFGFDFDPGCISEGGWHDFDQVGMAAVVKRRPAVRDMHQLVLGLCPGSARLG